MNYQKNISVFKYFAVSLFLIPIYFPRIVNGEFLKKELYDLNEKLLVENKSDGLNEEIKLLKEIKLIDEIEVLIKEINPLLLKNNFQEAIIKSEFILQKLNNEDPNYEFWNLHFQINDQIGELYLLNGQIDKAENIRNKLSDILLQRLGRNNEFFISTEIKLAGILIEKGLLKEAKEKVEFSIRNIQELYGENSLLLISPLNLSARINMELGEFENSKESLLFALKIIKEKMKNGKDNFYSEYKLLEFNQERDYLVSLQNLGFYYSELREFNQSNYYYQKALNLTRKNDRDSSVVYAIIINNIANNFLNQGDFNKAEELLLEALEINEKYETEPQIITNLQNLGTIYKEQLLLEKAEDYLKRAVNYAENYFGKDNVNITSTLNQLALVYSLNGEYEKANKIFFRILDLQKKSFPNNHPSISTTFNNIAYSYLYGTKSFKEAEKIYFERLKIDEDTFGKMHPRVATINFNLGKSYFKQKLFDKAEYHFKRALLINEKVFGIKNRELQNNLEALAHLYYLKRDFKNANKYYIKASKNSYDYISEQVPYLVDQERINLATFGMGIYIFNYSLENDLMAKNAFTTRLNRYGMLEDIERYQYEVMRSSDREMQILLKKRNQIIKKISNINLNFEQKKLLEKQKNSIEKKLNKLIPSFQKKFVEVKDIARNLKKDELLIQFTRYYPYDTIEETFDYKNPKYIALTLNSSSEINVFDLGSANKLENKIQNAYYAAKNLQDNIEFYLDDVSKDVFNELLKQYMEKYKTIYVSPDFALQKIPITLLRDPLNKNYLSLNKDFILLTSGKDLLRSESSKSSENKSLIISNPNYNFSSEKIFEKNPTLKVVKKNLRSKDLLSKKWQSIEGFELEGKEISNLINGNLITGSNASSKTFLNIKSPKILHIVTHGFYFSSTEEGENALRRTGIVLAGANNPNILDDGYLTALEISTMDLSGTDLVTISSCMSGEGDIRSYESLNGIRRALSLAGAKSTLLSLWEVDDTATTEFMIDFYKNLKKGMYKNEALSKTQKRFRNGIIKSKLGDDWTNIFYWGAFQISGDMSPVDFEE